MIRKKKGRRRGAKQLAAHRSKLKGQRHNIPRPSITDNSDREALRQYQRAMGTYVIEPTGNTEL